ncbi:MAG TPA: C39 family peptidase, partial [Prosthecobacter sp.]|nr:C39 family peptidase [Prosthecobacter sp.]
MPGAPAPEVFVRLKELQKRGRYVDAWELVRENDAPERWPEAEQRMRGARLLERLGAVERARRMVLREWRRKATRRFAREEVFWEVLRNRGALLTWQWLERYPAGADEDEEARMDDFGFRGYVLTKLRDFQRAEACLTEGLKLKADSRWLRLLRADLLETQDRREEALALVDEVLAADPHYVSAISTRAEILADLQRDGEAVATLQQGLGEVQSAQLAAQLANLLMELGQLDEAGAALDRYETLTPLREARVQDWIFARRCDLASHRGDQGTALEWAERIQKDGFYKRVAEKLKAAQGLLRREVLPVAFVRQHHSTCAPATVTSIANFWGHDVVHLDLAEEICYDGTPDYRERDWAEKNGWVTREFKVTVESAKQLIDAGMPFALNTVYPGGAHAQAVVGYDEFRTVLFIRDPGNRNTTEFLAEEALKEQAPFGPRGFVMVPPTEAERLAVLPLPDTEVYDLTHAISAGLYAHDRTRAAAALETLRRDRPNHLLRWHGELSMSRYDGNHSQTLRCLEELLKLHPEVVNWQTEQMHMIREVRGREALLTALREVCEKDGSHPLLWRMLARELQSDDRNRAEVARWLKRVHRCRVDAQAVVAQANLLWSERKWQEAAELYRLASCLDSRNEGLAMSYFNAARWTGQTEEALSMLRRRFEDEGHLSGQPACTLARALEQLDRMPECLAVLEESLKRRPDDADHAMYVAGELAMSGR